MDVIGTVLLTRHRRYLYGDMVKNILVVLVGVLFISGCASNQVYTTKIDSSIDKTSLKISSRAIRDSVHIPFMINKKIELSFYSDHLGCPDFKKNTTGYLHTQKLTKEHWESTVEIPSNANIYVLLTNSMLNETYYLGFKFNTEAMDSYEMSLERNTMGFGTGRYDDKAMYKISNKGERTPFGKISGLKLAQNWVGEASDYYYIDNIACN